VPNSIGSGKSRENRRKAVKSGNAVLEIYRDGWNVSRADSFEANGRMGQRGHDPAIAILQQGRREGSEK